MTADAPGVAVDVETDYAAADPRYRGRVVVQWSKPAAHYHGDRASDDVVETAVVWTGPWREASREDQDRAGDFRVAERSAADDAGRALAAALGSLLGPGSG